MAKLRHLAITTRDPDLAARFYEQVFEFRRIETLKDQTFYGHFLTDGTINLAILQFKTDEAAGTERGKEYVGLHHFGFEVDDVREAARRILAAGGSARSDIDRALKLGDAGANAADFKFADPDGNVFDLGGRGFFNLGQGHAAGGG